MSTELPTDPKVVKKMEKAIAKEAKTDEKEYGSALKELKRTERSEAQAFKGAGKAEKHLKKMEGKEHKAVRSLQKATLKHDRAVTDLHTAQSDVQIKNQRAQRIRHDTKTLRDRTGELLKAKEIREQERGSKLADLHSRAPGSSGTTVTTG